MVSEFTYGLPYLKIGIINRLFLNIKINILITTMALFFKNCSSMKTIPLFDRSDSKVSG